MWLVTRPGEHHLLIIMLIAINSTNLLETFESITFTNFPVKNALMLEPPKLDPLAYEWSIDGDTLCSTTVPE